MRRTASETIRDLEQRIAYLETSGSIHNASTLSQEDIGTMITMISILESVTPLYDTFFRDGNFNLEDKWTDFLRKHHGERNDISAAISTYNKEVKKAGEKLRKFLENKAGF